MHHAAETTPKHFIIFLSRFEPWNREIGTKEFEPRNSNRGIRTEEFELTLQRQNNTPQHRPYTRTHITYMVLCTDFWNASKSKKSCWLLEKTFESAQNKSQIIIWWLLLREFGMSSPIPRQKPHSWPENFSTGNANEFSLLQLKTPDNFVCVCKEIFC